MKSKKRQLIDAALNILIALGFPKEQQNERSALCLLALLGLTSEKTWSQSTQPLMGITPIMDWIRKNYAKRYAPNSRETFRRQTIHQFCEAGLVSYNPDKPDRPVNSPYAVYQITAEALTLIKTFNTQDWASLLQSYLNTRTTLAAKYAQVRKQELIPVEIGNNKTISLSPGEHSELIKAIIESFAPRFAPGSLLIYAGDTGAKWGYFDQERLAQLGVSVDSHGKMPDVVLHFTEKGWLILIESVTSHGPVDGKRHLELAKLFVHSTAGLVYVTAFPDRTTMSQYLSKIAWETEVWVADAPEHLIHFNGTRFLGPYA